jgi:hypothetical protein
MQTGDALVGFLVPLPVMFQSTPAIADGRCLDLVVFDDGVVVSIHARHC